MPTKSQPPAKPGDNQIRALADKRIREVLKTHGPDLPEAAVLEGFQDWVLPDRHLALIRERIERWRLVAAKKASRKAQA
ncbi:MAG: hypothetical protein M1436_05860 [Acidobacteria bacterium]|nr:hypothetical protein [Acidobacteriota bacterium]